MTNTAISDMSDSELVRERHGAVLLVRLNRPAARNALTQSLFTALGTAMLDAESDPGIRAMVVTGTGDRAFCAGMDLQSFADGEEIGTVMDEPTACYFRALRGELAVPLIGAANGTAIGGGLELLLACDVIVASETARFGFPEVKRGLFPVAGGTFLGTRIPTYIALEMLLTGDPVDAARAYEIGMVNSVVPQADVVSAALELAGRIAANAPLGLAAVKELTWLGVLDGARARARLEELSGSVFASEDAKEGAMAFVERREPVWKGR